MGWMSPGCPPTDRTSGSTPDMPLLYQYDMNRLIRLVPRVGLNHVKDPHGIRSHSYARERNWLQSGRYSSSAKSYDPNIYVSHSMLSVSCRLGNV